ncbi:MAG: PLDc N-terminal domain-containing protein [Bacteroidota bacterium]|nr:PLDc N-terminal domain-containing protein [Bacteroidota bacterium]
MFYGGSYYYLVVILEIFCAIHCVRRGTQGKWLWIIIFLPLIGSLIYVYSEILSNRSFRGPNIDVGSVINPRGKKKNWKRNFNLPTRSLTA